MEVETNERLGYVRSIDGLRALAVLAIVAFHLEETWLPAGFFGVDVFFVISGFVVCSSVLGREPAGFRSFAAAFYARRMRRILPALLVCLLVTALVSTLFVPHAWLSGMNQRAGIAAFVALSNFYLAYFAGDYFAPQAEFNPFTHTWSLGAEEQFYFIFPVLAYFLVRPAESAPSRRRVLAYVSLLTLGSLGWCAFESSRAPYYAFYLLPSRFWELGVGLILAVTRTRWQPRIAAWSPGFVHAAGGAVLVALAASFVLPRTAVVPFPWATLPVATTAAAIALAVARPASWWERWLSFPALVRVGKMSYSLYLWHWPVFVLARWTIGLESPGQRALASIVALLAAVASYELVERPFRESPRARATPAARLLVAGFASIAVAGSIAGGIFLARPWLSRSVTARAAGWFPQDGPNGTDARGPCRLTVKRSPFAGGFLAEYRPVDCPRRPQTLYVLGDSHATSYLPMLREFSSHTGVAVTLAHRGGCVVFDLLLRRVDRPPGCQPYHDAALALVAERAVAGDVLFLPSLRLHRPVRQSGPRVPSPLSPAERFRATIHEEALAALRPLARRGVHVAFEAPKPMVRVPVYRCVDWFNADNPYCRAGFEVPRNELLSRRAEVLRAIETLVVELGNASVWDPFPVLCPGDVCSAFRDGKPLFFDTDHTSDFANHVLAPSFTAHVRGVLGAPAPAPALRASP